MATLSTTNNTDSLLINSDNNNNTLTTTDYDFLIKFLALGDSGVGKTTFLHQYTDGKFEDRFTSTVGIDFTEKTVLYKSTLDDGSLGRSHKIHLQLWDTAGQERYRSLTTAFFRDSMGFILMFDLTNQNSFLNLRNWVTQLKLNAYSDDPDIILCANKADLNDFKISEEEIKKFADSYGMPYFLTSSVSGKNVNKVIETLLSRVMLRISDNIDKSEIINNYIARHNNKSNIDVNNDKNSGFCGC